MVRVYDPTRTDPTIYFLRGIQDYLYRRTNTLNFNETNKAIDNFLSQTQYKTMISDYEKSEKAFPDIVVKSNCAKDNFFLRKTKQDFKNFKGYFEPTNNRIYLCSNYIVNLLEVKENLDRELIMAYDHNIRKVDDSKDSDMACSVIRSCRAQLNNYAWNEDLTKEMTKICAKHLFKVVS